VKEIGVGLLGVVVMMHALSTAAETQAGAAKGDAQKGKILFVKYCTGCHGTGGQGDGYRLLGPSPADLTAPSTDARSDAELLKTIHEGKPNMPAWRFRFTAAESQDVLAYVRTLRSK
jgi:mono/diheme cytochrome c family protein